MSDETSDNKGGKEKPHHDIDGELSDLLIEIEDEPVPERLLELAMKLQTALMLRSADRKRN